MVESRELLQYWKDQYFNESENLKKYGGSYWWGFETDVFFTETDHMILICCDIEKKVILVTDIVH